MKKTTWLMVAVLLLALAGKSRSQVEFVSSKQSAANFNLGYATNSKFNLGSVGGGLIMNGWSEGHVYLAVSDLGAYAGTVYALGVGVRPFVRALETESVTILLGLPTSVEFYSTMGGPGFSSYGSFGSIGGSVDVPIRTGEVSRFDLSFSASYGDYLSGDDFTDGGTTSATVGVAQSVGIGRGSLLILGFGTTFVEDADEATLLFQLGFVFPKPR